MTGLLHAGAAEPGRSNGSEGTLVAPIIFVRGSGNTNFITWDAN